MPLGSFLHSLPTFLYVGAHLIFLPVGLWAENKSKVSKARFASAFWLYIMISKETP
jgi:hypothetical protein